MPQSNIYTPAVLLRGGGGGGRAAATAPRPRRRRDPEWWEPLAVGAAQEVLRGGIGFGKMAYGASLEEEAAAEQYRRQVERDEAQSGYRTAEAQAQGEVQKGVSLYGQQVGRGGTKRGEAVTEDALSSEEAQALRLQLEAGGEFLPNQITPMLNTLSSATFLNSRRSKRKTLIAEFKKVIPAMEGSEFNKAYQAKHGGQDTPQLAQLKARLKQAESTGGGRGGTGGAPEKTVKGYPSIKVAPAGTTAILATGESLSADEYNTRFNRVYLGDLKSAMDSAITSEREQANEEYQGAMQATFHSEETLDIGRAARAVANLGQEGGSPATPESQATGWFADEANTSSYKPEELERIRQMATSMGQFTPQVPIPARERVSRRQELQQARMGIANLLDEANKAESIQLRQADNHVGYLQTRAKAASGDDAKHKKHLLDLSKAIGAGRRTLNRMLTDAGKDRTPDSIKRRNEEFSKERRRVQGLIDKLDKLKPNITTPGLRDAINKVTSMKLGNARALETRHSNTLKLEGLNRQQTELGRQETAGGTTMRETVERFTELQLNKAESLISKWAAEGPSGINKARGYLDKWKSSQQYPTEFTDRIESLIAAEESRQYGF